MNANLHEFGVSVHSEGITCHPRQGWQGGLPTVEGPRTRHWRSRRTLFADGHGAVMTRRLKLAPRHAMYSNMEHARISPYAHRAGYYTRESLRSIR